MKRIDLATEDAVVLSKRAKHRRMEWCRLRNEFIDDPLWRVVAQLTGLPLFQVQAFVVRLESLANKSEPRGFVGDFSAVEFGAAHGMPTDEAARIYAALEHRDVGWIDQGHVVTFYPRNPDKEDATAPDRDRRRRARQWIRRELDRRLAAGSIDPDLRDEAEAMLGALPDAELFRLQAGLRKGQALEAALSTAAHATPATPWHAVAFVAATPRAEHSRSETTAAVDNIAAGARGEGEGLPKEDAVAAEQLSTEATAWLSAEGARLVVACMHESTTRAQMLIERWGRDLGDDKRPLVEIIHGTAVAGLTGAKFLVSVEQQVERARRLHQKGAELKLPPGLVSGGKLGAKAAPDTRWSAEASEALLQSPLVKRGKLA